MPVENIHDHQAFKCECGSVHVNLLRSSTIECAGCGKRFGYWANGFDREFLYAALGEIVDRIEKCGASVELTDASSLACDLRQAIGNQWNDPSPYALNWVKKTVFESLSGACGSDL